MEKIYCALSGLNSVDPVALIGTSSKYEFNDIHNWTSHVFIACAREETELETVNTVMKHIRETINFAQFDDSTIRDMIINLSTIFGRKDVTQKAWYARFIIDLLRTRNDNSTDKVCYGKLVSLENVAIWAMQSLLTDDKIIAAFFIGLYSMLGNHELQIIQQNIKKEIRATFIEIFEDDLNSKLDAGLRLNYMLFFFNIWSQNPASHSAQIASKMFQNPETMMMTIRICAETIANDSGGLGGLKTACNLLKRVAHHNSSMFLDYEIKQDSSSSKKKTATKVIKSCISVLRNESESDKKATILELLLSLSRINDEIKQTIIARLSQDERQNDSITIVLSEKDPLRHGSLPCLATKLIASLDADSLNLSTTLLETQFQNLKGDLNKTTERNIFFVFQKVAYLTDLLRRLIKMDRMSTQMDEAEGAIFGEVSNILCNLKASFPLINYAFVGLHCWLSGSAVETKLVQDIRYKLFLTQSIAVLMSSQCPKTRRLATDLLRCVPDNVYDAICTPRVFEFFKIEEEAPKRSKSNDLDDDKENAKDETVRTRVSRRLSRAPLNIKNESKNDPIDTKKRKRDVSDDDEPDSYAICQSLREQLAQTQDILNSERQLRQSLEKMLAVSTSNQNLSKRLIISIDNSKMEVVDERQARKEVEEEMEIMVRSIMTRGRKYIK